ncbi:hypothetical protein C8R46DRAFT_1050301 [Mycena filopes]|nr:hypothetical protein C8R46DRAFT_1050301 [Mycena filopes]
MRVDEEVEQSRSWQGIGGHCRLAIPRSALERMDDVTYLTANENFDDLGRLRDIEPATTADWYHSTEPYRGYIPTSPEAGQVAEWFQALGSATPHERTEAGRWRIPAGPIMENDLIAFRDAVEAIAEHPKYDINIWSPAAFNSSDLQGEFSTLLDLQIAGTQAKRGILDMWGHLAWWISSIPDWNEDLPVEVVEHILGWNLLSRPKRGFLVSLTQDWTEMNFGLLIRLGVPLYYVWGTPEESDPRFLRLSPRLLEGYRNACQSADLRAMWGEEIAHLRLEFQECAKYDAFLQLRQDPRAREKGAAPVWTEETGRITYKVKDFDTWKRRPLEADEDWRQMDKLYHHALVEYDKTQTTTVIFLRFHRRPGRVTLTAEDDFMDEEIVENDPNEFRERFKARCAPRPGQIFDPETGVERTRPVNFSDEIESAKFQEQKRIVPPTNGVGRSIGPRSTGPSSDHSSERRRYDAARPMGHSGGWVAAMARLDHAGNYDIPRSLRRMRFDLSPPRGASEGGTLCLSYTAKNSPRVIPPGHPVNRVRDKLIRRAGWLNDTKKWAAQITSTVVLWQIPPQYGWNMRYLKEGRLIISESAEVRLRLLALMTLGVRFARHVLELGIEHGIAFQIALERTTYPSFAPNAPLEHRATTKALLESGDRRLEASSSPMVTHARYLRLLGEVAGLANARGLIGRGGTSSWIVRAHGYISLVQDFMSGPSPQVTVYHGGANDAIDEPSLGLHWDEINESDYQALHGFVPGPTREKDAWVYPTDEVLEEMSKHYYREWNGVVDDHFQRIKKEWDERPCRGKLRNKKEWGTFFYTSNHGRFAPDIEVNNSWIEEGRDRLHHAFEGSWNRKQIWEIAVPEVFKQKF